MCVLDLKRNESHFHPVQFIYAILYEHSYQISIWEKKYTLKQNSVFSCVFHSFIYDALKVNDKKNHNDTYQVSNENYDEKKKAYRKNTEELK